MSFPYETAEYEIERVCGYIMDDQTVANYFGIERQRVSHIRDKMRNSTPRWLLRSANEGTNNSQGTNSHLTAAYDAEVGSRSLNERIQGLFQKFAQKHGITKDEARILLLDTGVSL